MLRVPGWHVAELGYELAWHLLWVVGSTGGQGTCGRRPEPLGVSELRGSPVISLGGAPAPDSASPVTAISALSLANISLSFRPLSTFTRRLPSPNQAGQAGKPPPQRGSHLNTSCRRRGPQAAACRLSPAPSGAAAGGRRGPPWAGLVPSSSSGSHACLCPPDPSFRSTPTPY